MARPSKTDRWTWIKRRLQAWWHSKAVYGWCFCCKRQWDIVEGHRTYDPEGTSGCFPLCEECWADMTPEERVPYYDRLFADWEADWKKRNDKSPTPDDDYSDLKQWRKHLNRMRQAVLAGG